MKATSRTHAELIEEISLLKQRIKELEKSEPELGRSEEEALRKNEDKLKSIFRAAPVGIGVVSDRVIMEANDRLCDMTGYKREELIGQSARMLYPDAKDFNFVGREKYRQITEAGTGTVETRWRMKNGKVIHILLSSTPIDPTNMSKGVTFTALDISHRKLTEEALRESEEKYRTIVENTNDAIYIHDFEGNIIDVNENACRMVGYTRDELVGANLAKIDKTWSLSENKELEQLIREGKSVFERVNVRKDGSFVPIEVSVKIINHEEKGTIQGFVRDITERKRAEEAFLCTQKLESLGVLAGGIAHDFNNLMTTLLGYVELAMMKLPANHPSYPLLKAALQSTEQTRDLTGRLITFSRGGSIIKQVSNISDVLRETVLKTAQRDGIEVIIDVEKDLWLAEVDEAQVRQVFYHLSINAVEAMPWGGTLTVKAENTIVHANNELSLQEGPYLRITFVDNGIGITKENLVRILDPYFTTKSMGLHKGVGLGLSVCYSVLKKHGGHITVASRPGKGTTFAVYLPAVIEKGMKAAPSAPVSNYRVLVMEDEETVRKLERAFLTQLGCDVTETKDGQEAIDRYKEAVLSKHPFDLVMLDLVVRQGMGGQQTMEGLLKEDPSVRAIIISGYVDDPVIEHYSDYGFRKAMKKPFRFQELQEVIAAVMSAET